MKEYSAPSVTDNKQQVSRTVSIAGAFLAGTLAALGAAMRGDKIVEHGLLGLEPCID